MMLEKKYIDKIRNKKNNNIR